MSDSQKKLAAVAQDVNIDLPQDVLQNMAALLTRLEQNLSWPGWDEAQSVSSGFEAASSTRTAKIVPPIEEALGKARLVSDGGAYTKIDIEGARAAAQMLDTEDKGGALAGIPVAVKDLVAVAGQPLSAASAVRANAPVSVADAPIVAALRRAGAIITGTVALHEFAFGVTGINDYSGTVPNPHDPSRVPGGSSSGSAVAVAEGSAQIAIGTDTGGSVRIPAALCGVVGFKPAFGTYPIDGVFPLSPTLDHVGFLARSVADIRLVHNYFAPAVSGEHRPARVGLLRAELEQSDLTVKKRFESVLQQLIENDCEVIDIDDIWPNSEDIFAVSTTIMFSEAATIHKRNLSQHANRYGADVRNRLMQGLAISATDYVTALHARRRLKAQVHTVLSSVDCVIGPTVGIVAPTIEEARDPAVSGQLVAFTRLGNVTGTPVLSLPIPGQGLPVGLQILSNENDRALRVAAYLEKLVSIQSGQK